MHQHAPMWLLCLTTLVFCLGVFCHIMAYNFRIFLCTATIRHAIVERRLQKHILTSAHLNVGYFSNTQLLLLLLLSLLIPGWTTSNIDDVNGRYTTASHNAETWEKPAICDGKYMGKDGETPTCMIKQWTVVDGSGW